jgi:hypothetical protein
VGLFKKKPPEGTEVTVHSETIDASNMGDLRGDILDTLKEHGIEPGRPQVISAGDVPGLTEEIMGALNQAGVWEHDDPVEQLAKLAELHKKGALSDYEFAVAKQKLLSENWDSAT